jgi:hypothetical protein
MNWTRAFLIFVDISEKNSMRLPLMMHLQFSLLSVDWFQCQLNKNSVVPSLFLNQLECFICKTALNLIGSSMVKVQLCILLVLLLASVLCESEEKYCETIKDCEADPNYPEEILNKLNLESYSFEERYTDEIRKRRSVDINSDANQYLVEAKLCESLISFKRPRLLKNTKNEWRTIVNHDNFTQLIRREECSSANFPCTWNIYPKAVRSFCQQTDSTVTLWALDEQRNCLVMDKFNVPTSCDCIIEKEDLFRGVKQDLLRRPWTEAAVWRSSANSQ